MPKGERSRIARPAAAQTNFEARHSVGLDDDGPLIVRSTVRQRIGGLSRAIREMEQLLARMPKMPDMSETHY